MNNLLLQEVSNHASGGKSSTAERSSSRSSKGLGAAGALGTLILASSVGGAGSIGTRSRRRLAGSIGLLNVLGSAKVLNVRLAGHLIIVAADVLGIALAEKLVANESRHRLGVVLEARSGAVGCAGALPCEGILSKSVSPTPVEKETVKTYSNAVVHVSILVTKHLASVLLALAPSGYKETPVSKRELKNTRQRAAQWQRDE